MHTSTSVSFCQTNKEMYNTYCSIGHNCIDQLQKAPYKSHTGIDLCFTLGLTYITSTTNNEWFAEATCIDYNMLNLICVI